MRRPIDHTGERFGRAIAVAEDPVRDKGRGARWDCICDCGKMFVAPARDLVRGHTQSCGCLATEHTQRMHAANVTHGQSHNHRTREYATWENMKSRCLNPHATGYANYGGRNITITPRWLIFENFFADLGPKPKGLSLDRIDNDGNYEPGNARWATPYEQVHNRRPPRRRSAHRCLSLTIQGSGAFGPSMRCRT
jgi:hypothetical protein